MEPNNLPQLKLSSEQILIIDAHAQAAAAELLNMTFDVTGEELQKRLLAHAYQKARLSLCHELVNYDAATLLHAKENN